MRPKASISRAMLGAWSRPGGVAAKWVGLVRIYRRINPRVIDRYVFGVFYARNGHRTEASAGYLAHRADSYVGRSIACCTSAMHRVRMGDTGKVPEFWSSREARASARLVVEMSENGVVAYLGIFIRERGCESVLNH